MRQCASPRLILASASAARRTLLAAAGLVFDIIPADIDEAAAKRDARARGLEAVAAALHLADCKAAAVARYQPEALVIGADQILECGGVWFDKPAAAVAAREQLLALRGRSHTLATAVVCHRGDLRVWHEISTPRISMRAFSDDFLDWYMAAEGDGVTGTVGAYRLEGRGVQFFDAVDGDYSAVLGLPLLPLLDFLRRTGTILA